MRLTATNRKPVITSHIDNVSKHDYYTSITEAARRMDLHPSTISRAASGDRGIMSAGNRIVTYA